MAGVLSAPMHKEPNADSDRQPSARERVLAWLTADVSVLVLVGLARVLLQVFTNDTYGFFRDELVTLDDARHLDWGYVAYPPLTPFFGRLALELFGLSLNGIRLFPLLSQAVVMVLVGLTARAMGAKRFGQVLAALAAGTTPACIVISTLLHHVAFDYLWWVLVAYFAARLLATNDARYWLGIGAGLGLGVLTKYTIAFWVVGLLVGLLLTPQRRRLRSPWLPAGAALGLAIALPNLIWQARHGFISLAFLRSIHARDVRLGRADGFLLDQIKNNGSLAALALIVAGLGFLLLSSAGRRFRALAWAYLATLALFLIARGRGYYLLPAYAPLIAAGAVWFEQAVSRRSEARTRQVQRAILVVVTLSAAPVVYLTLPTAPVNSPRWRLLSALNENLREEIGWPELLDTIAGVYRQMPADERPGAAVLAGNGGEVGAVNLLGSAYGLPRAISGFNSLWMRGYGDPPPQSVIAVGLSRELLDRTFETCDWAARVTNRYGIRNEETDSANVYLCRHLRQPWPDFWKGFHYFG